MATSLDALEALLQFREGRPAKRPRAARAVRLPVPIPNPLDPTVPHLIEGDCCAPARRSRSTLAPPPAAGSVATAVATPATAVTDPLAARSSKKRPAPLLAPPATVGHGFGVRCPAASPRRRPLEVEVRTDKIKDALRSKPQRGKKRDNLNDLERLELTRTRNREHARCTRIANRDHRSLIEIWFSPLPPNAPHRMKKKARLEHLVNIEKKYTPLQAKEALSDLRRRNLEDLVENAAEGEGGPSSKLHQLASQVVQRPEFSLAARVVLAEDCGMVKVSVRGHDFESGELKTLSGVVCAEFGSGTADVCSASVYWSSPERNAQDAQRAGIPPSASVLSFAS
ncbi:hypothetical protein ACHAWF_002268 [Thalassiosira exigua]